MKYMSICVISFIALFVVPNTLYSNEMGTYHLSKSNSGSDTSVDSTGPDPKDFAATVLNRAQLPIAKQPTIRGSLEDITQEVALEIPETILEDDSVPVTRKSTPFSLLFKRRSKSIQPLPQLDIQPETPQEIKILFAEFEQPETPSLEKLELYGLPLYFEHDKSHVSIIFAPKGGPCTPTKNSLDLGDKTGDSDYDELKRNLQQHKDAPHALLIALLAKTARNYIRAKELGQNVPPEKLKRVALLAAQHNNQRIAEIVRNVLQHKPDASIYHAYKIELCNLQKPAEKILTAAGLKLLRSGSQTDL